MKNRYSSNNQISVPVLDKHGQPLAPARPSRVRKWLEAGRARKVWLQGIFAVQLHDLDAIDCTVGNFSLGLDPGELTGTTVTRESADGNHRTVVGAYEHQHRNREISSSLKKRSSNRGNRRGRLRHRPARFNNRTKPQDWLAPSLQSIVDDFAAIADVMIRLYPINRIRVEYLRFDTQLMQDPNIQGKEYQEGTLHGWQLRHYVFHRDEWTCQYCGKAASDKRLLTLDHVIPQASGGTRRVDNLVAACQRCNTKKSNKPVEEFLARKPEQLAKVQEQLRKIVPLTATGHLNSVMPAVLKKLEATGLPVTVCDGVSTAYTRKALGIAKTHVNDAACLGLPESVSNLPERVILLKRQGRHHRQSINCDRNGSPASKDFPTYSHLPRQVQGYTRPPGHSTGPRQRNGIRSGDVVRIRHRSGVTYTGRCTLALKGNRVKIKGAGPGGSTISAKPSKASLVAHAGRWHVSRKDNA